MNKNIKRLNLYEILVPAYAGKDVNSEWDNKISRITKGLTILKPVKGGFLIENEVLKEDMVPVRIACKENQIEEIMDITAEHYKQKAIMLRLIPGEVLIKDYQ